MRALIGLLLLVSFDPLHPVSEEYTGLWGYPQSRVEQPLRVLVELAYERQCRLLFARLHGHVLRITSLYKVMPVRQHSQYSR